jgi:hypothetical protein
MSHFVPPPRPALVRRPLALGLPILSAALIMLAPRGAAADEPGGPAVAAPEHERAEIKPAESKESLAGGRLGPAGEGEGRAGADKPGESEKGEKEEEEPAWEVIGDFASGATTTQVLTEGKAGAPTPANVFDSTRVSAFTFLVGVERHLGERLTVGARMPVIVANLTSRTGAADARTATAAGNVELEGAWVIARGKEWNVVGTLELALPTAGGVEPPTRDEVAAEADKRFSYKRYDTFAAVHAGAAIRGAYESALFEPGNIGIIPKIAASFRISDLTISPMVKLENLIEVTGDAEEVYINELVAGVRAGYRVAAHVEPGVHLWVRELHEHTHSDDAYSAVGVVEPYVRFPFAAVKPTVSAILPFAGGLAKDKTFGVRAGVVAEF